MPRGPVRRQDFGAKFNLIYHNGVPVANILKFIILERADRLLMSHMGLLMTY